LKPKSGDLSAGYPRVHLHMLQPQAHVVNAENGSN